MQSAELLAISYLPPDLATCVRNAMALYGETFQELRLYCDASPVLVYGNRNIRVSGVCCAETILQTVCALCGNSLYAHEETLRNGYIYTVDGLRVGVCGRAVCDGERLAQVTDISSLCIRIPHRIPGAADPLLPLLREKDPPAGILIWSPPGVGKTTVLHELAAVLPEGTPSYRVAVVDTRMELGMDVRGADILRGYPRAVGMETAIRTLSPQIVICDEIYTQEDCRAVLYGASCGVAMIASTHASCFQDLEHREALRTVLQSDVFSYFVGLRKTDGIVRYEIRSGQSCALRQA